MEKSRKTKARLWALDRVTQRLAENVLSLNPNALTVQEVLEQVRAEIEAEGAADAHERARLIDAAYSNDDNVEIDDDAEISVDEGSNSAWVQAWLRVET